MSFPGSFACSSAPGSCGASGVCEATGYCAAPDPTCSAYGGYRYSSTASPSYAGKCVGAAPAGAGVCSPDGWCWQVPGSTGNDLYGAWASSPSDLWVVGDVGTLEHWDGKTWSGQTDFAGDATFLAVWAADASHVWAVGKGGVVAFYDGTTWSSSTLSGDLDSVWGTSTTDVWAAGSGGTLFHWDGTAWKGPIATGTTGALNAVFTAAANDVWVVGAGGTILHCTGACASGGAWTAPTFASGVTPPTANLNAVWGVSAGKVWIGGDGGTSLAWNGSVLGAGPALPASLSIESLSGQSLSGGGPSLWFAGKGGTIYQVDPTGAIVMATTDTMNNLHAIVATGASDVWAFGDGGAAEHWTGSGPFAGPVGALGQMVGVSASGPGNAVAVANWGDAIQWNGTRWSSLGGPGFGDPVVWTSGPTDAWVIGYGKTAHWTGSAWSTGMLGTSTNKDVAAFGTSATDVWAADLGDLLFHWTGGAWVQSSAPAPIRALWGSSASNVYGVGDSATVIRWDGRSWSQLTPSVCLNPSSLYGVSGGSPTDVWMIAPWVAVHYDGASTWTPYSSLPLPSPAFKSVLAAGNGHAWIGDASGAILHWDNVGWSKETTGTTGAINALSGATGGSGVWAAADNGILYHPPQ